jgi:hypothetical protein
LALVTHKTSNAEQIVKVENYYANNVVMLHKKDSA